MKIKLEEKTQNALEWIVSILDKNNIPYRIGGGLAAKVYGSPRPVNDIDISLEGKYFPGLIPQVSEYITSGPKHYKNEKWDCDTVSLLYEGQEIDITDIDTLRMSNKELTHWFQTKDHFRRFPICVVDVNGVKVSLIHPRDLVAYKNELVDDGHSYQQIDVDAVEDYIRML